jgi:proteasome lid subunit RPN8/RPN11
MKVVLPEKVAKGIRHHAEATYPEECCGFLIAKDLPPPSDATRRILRAVPMENRMEGARRRRFVIPPEELRRFETTLEGTEESVVGFYHSHPDHPAVPSLFDQEHAWPWYTYIVLTVQQGRAGTIGAFEMDAESRQFTAVPCNVEPEPLRAR